MRVERSPPSLASLGLWLRRGPRRAAAQDARRGLAPPTPRVVIYPGDIIRDDMLADLPADTAERRRAVRRVALGG